MCSCKKAFGGCHQHCHWKGLAVPLTKLPRCLLCNAQLTAAPGNPSTDYWNAAAWIGATRDANAASGWADANGATASLPWCPGEPNNKGSVESCTDLMTGCGASGAAVNDFACDRHLRVLCAFPSSSCSGSGAGGGCACSGLPATMGACCAVHLQSGFLQQPGCI